MQVTRRPAIAAEYIGYTVGDNQVTTGAVSASVS
jgi:hypothetical protein